MIKEEIKSLIEKAVKELGLEVFNFSVEIPGDKNHGDYSTNIALVLSGQIGKNPMEVAQKLVSNFQLPITNLFEKVKVVAPGFINFFISKEYLEKELKKILKEKEKYGHSKKGKGKTIVIDYSGVNIAKPFGIGHLRSTIIGQAIYNLYNCLGYRVVGDNHIGDWGTQFGKLIYAIKNWGNEKDIRNYSVKSLVALYIKFHEEAEKNKELEVEGRKWFEKLEKGDKEARKIWKECVKISLKEFERVYKILGVDIDLTLGESFYESMLKDVIQEAEKKGLAQKSEGAIIIPFPNDVLPPLMIEKSDGATLYSTRDLATIKYRLKKFKPDKIIYEVGSEQSLHFKQLFLATELLGWAKKERLVHVAHGLMRLETGKMSTRKGEIIYLQDVLNEAVERAGKIIEEKNPNLVNKAETARIIGIGGVKYNDLSSHPSTDIIFDWDKVLNLEGNSGPYLQYAYIRARNIIEKSKEKVSFKELEFKENKEIDLLRKLEQYPYIIEKAAESYSPNFICNYLFELAKEFNSFYETVPVLKSEEDFKFSRLSLVEAVSQVIKNGLDLLGIEVPEKM
jgi:arginyl-tRNA synthetase